MRAYLVTSSFVIESFLVLLFLLLILARYCYWERSALLVRRGSNGARIGDSFSTAMSARSTCTVTFCYPVERDENPRLNLSTVAKPCPFWCQMRSMLLWWVSAHPLLHVCVNTLCKFCIFSGMSCSFFRLERSINCDAVGSSSPVGISRLLSNQFLSRVFHWSRSLKSCWRSFRLKLRLTLRHSHDMRLAVVPLGLQFGQFT